MKSTNILGFIAVFLSATVLAQQGPSREMPKDPFIGGRWHAIEQTWPGTIEFNEKGHQVVLLPSGAKPIKATYRYSVKKSSVGGESSQQAGDLTMTASSGEISKSAYVIDGQKLTLKGQGGVETYKRMTLEEEKAGKQALKNALEKVGK